MWMYLIYGSHQIYRRHEYQGVYNGRIVIDLEKMKASQQKAT